MDKVLTLSLPLILGPVTFLVVQIAKRTSDTLDTLGPSTKRIVVAIVAIGLTLLSSALGVASPCDASASDCLTSLNGDAVKSLLAALIAYGIHTAKPKASAG